MTSDATVALPQPPAPKPMYAFGVTAANRNDEVKLSGAFAKLTDEDPALRLEHERETHQTLLWGQGEIHLRVALDRLKNKYNVEVEPHAARTPYRETIRKSAQAHGRHKKQSGGHGQFGDVKIEIRPLERGQGFQFENKVVGGAVPRQFVPAVEAGAREHLQRGPLGFPVVDVAVTLNDGQFHSVDSNELSFKLAAGQALKEGLPHCEPVLLEPILSVTISVPADYTAKALQLVSGKRGQIMGYEAKPDWNGWDEISAQIPQGRDARPDRHPALAEPGHRILRLGVRPPPGGARTGWLRRSSTSTGISRHSRRHGRAVAADRHADVAWPASSSGARCGSCSPCCCCRRY